MGEPPLFLAASVFYAIKEAIASARRERGVKGKFLMDSPATCERIRMACVDQFTKQVIMLLGIGDYVNHNNVNSGMCEI